MERQPDDRARPAPGDRRPRTARRVRLTDQALVAVTVARQIASSRQLAEQRTRATVTDLLVGLATETEGRAGQVLRAQPNAALALHNRAEQEAGQEQERDRTVGMDVAIGWAAGETTERPLWTLDLLHAACEVGGSGLAALLSDCGLRADRMKAAASDHARPDDVTETFGLGMTGDPVSGDLSAAAASAVARARAAGGGAVPLLFALARESHADRLPLDAEHLRRRWERLGQTAERVDEGWDAGVDSVIETARVLRLGSEPLSPLDLLRACAVAGGQGPARLLAPDA